MQNESYNIYEITNKNTWDSFVTSQPNHTLLHSWEWGEFNEVMGDKIFRIGIYNKNVTRNGGVTLVAACLVIKVHARRGNFLFVPHGPIFFTEENRENPKSEGQPEAGPPQAENPKQAINSKFKILKTFTEKFKKIAKQEKVSFIRISPLLEDTEENKVMFKKLGFRDAPIHMHAETTWTLDISPPEDKLLMGMRKTTRNLIRRALKEGVEIRIGNSEEDVEIFNDLYKETVSKHNFVPYTLTYLKNQVKILEAAAAGSDGVKPLYNRGQIPKESSDIRVFIAYYKNEPLASAIIVFYGNSAFYHHGASSMKYPKIPAAYLIQWEAIKEAKRRGHKFYNFWGIIKEENPNPSFANATAGRHPWAGITLFKKGFGGFETDYLHAQDMPLSWKYWPNYILETRRRKKRGL